MKKLFALLLLASPLRAAITLDSAGTPFFSNFLGNVVTISHTCSGSDRLLMVLVNKFQNGAEDVPTVAYNGTSMTLSTGVFAGGAGAYIFYLTAPATGAHNVVITFSGDGRSISQAISWNGVDQSAPIDGKKTASDANTGAGPATLSLSVTGGGSGIVVDTFAAEDDFFGGYTFTPGAGQTVQGTLDEDEIGTFFYRASSKAQGASSTSMLWNLGGIDEGYDESTLAAVALKESSAGPTPTPTMPINFKGLSMRGVSSR